MAKTNQPAEDQGDKLIKGIPIEESEAPEVETPAPEKEPEVIEPKPEAEPEKEPVIPQEQKPEPTAPAPKPPVVEKKPEDTVPPATARPERYIPIAQYTSEKKGWRESEEGYKKRIAELETIKSSEEGGKKREEAIKAYAEKYGVDIESVRDLATMFSASEEKKPEAPAPVAPLEPKEPELSADQQRALDEANEIRAKNAYEEEFTNVAIPEIRNLFPKATPEQLEKAKKELEAMATTRQYLDKSLDFIVYKERQAFGEIFKEVPQRKGAESGRTAPTKSATDLSASDFSSDSDFAMLADLNQSERDAIVKKFTNAQWTRYKNYVKANDELEINS